MPWQKDFASPQSCGIQVYEQEWGFDENHNDKDISIVTYDDTVGIKVNCVSGATGCWGEDLYTMHGETYSCEGEKDSGLATYTVSTVKIKTKAKDDADLSNLKIDHESDSELAGTTDHELHHVNFVLLGVIGMIIAYWVIWTVKFKNNKNMNFKFGTYTVVDKNNNEAEPLILAT